MSKFKNDGVLVQEYFYDFATDGGLVSKIILSDKNQREPLPVGAILKQVTMRVKTQFTSGGSATLTVGNGDDPDGYMASIAVAGLTAAAMFNGHSEAGALLWDDTNDHAIYSDIADANGGEVSITIGTSAMTAGAAQFICEFYFPTDEDSV